MKDCAEMEAGEKRLSPTRRYSSCFRTDTVQGEPTKNKLWQNMKAIDIWTTSGVSFLSFHFWFLSLKEEPFRQWRTVLTFIRPPTHLSCRRLWRNEIQFTRGQKWQRPPRGSGIMLWSDLGQLKIHEDHVSFYLTEYANERQRFT